MGEGCGIMRYRNMSVKNKKIMMIAPKTESLVNFRGDLIKDIREKGYDVVVVVPEDERSDFFKENQVKIRLVNLKKNSFSVFNVLTYYRTLKKIIKVEQPDKVFSYTVKPVIFGSMAAKKAGVGEIYSLICGLGLLFCSDGWKIRMVRGVVGVLYKRALRYNTKVIFQNKEDIVEFVGRGYVEEEKCELVDGSGVDLARFKRNKLPKGKVSFLMVSRILKEKGVMVYLKAAKMVKEKYPDVEFVYIGSVDKNKNALDFDLLKPYFEDGIVEYVPETKEVEKYIAKCSAFVLPTYYREGIPKTILEALAMGRPILTTNTPGCRETVVEGRNGFFVQVKRAGDLAEKMIWMIENRDQLQAMGDKSFKLCKERFTIEKIDTRMMKIMGMV